MSCWIVEPPIKNSVLIDNSCRIVEVDDDGKFVKVIARLHPDIDADSAAIMCCVLEMFDCINHIDRELDSRTYPDDEETENDTVLDLIEEHVTTILDLINEQRSQSK